MSNKRKKARLSLHQFCQATTILSNTRSDTCSSALLQVCLCIYNSLLCCLLGSSLKRVLEPLTLHLHHDTPSALLVGQPGRLGEWTQLDIDTPLHAPKGLSCHANVVCMKECNKNYSSIDISSAYCKVRLKSHFTVAIPSDTPTVIIARRAAGPRRTIEGTWS